MRKKILNISLLLLPIFILNIISIINMYNTKYLNSYYNNNFIKQIIWIIISIILLIIINKFKIKKIYKYSNYFYIFNIILLILVLFIGTSINGAKCWFTFFNFSFEPSELVNLSLSLYGIKIIENNKDIKLFIKLILITLIPSILVFLEPDTGAIINYLLIFLVLFFNSKLDKKYYILFFISIFILLISIISIYFYNKDILINIFGNSIFYRIDRLINFKNGYQLENSLISIGATSFFKFNINNILIYIPEAPTDFIFSFSCGNLGIFSALLIIICYLILIIFLIIKGQNNILIKTFVITLLYHIIYNISMNIGLLPIMGIPLPFLSYGGSNMILNYIFIGLIINNMDNNNYNYNYHMAS